MILCVCVEGGGVIFATVLKGIAGNHGVETDVLTYGFSIAR